MKVSHKTLSSLGLATTLLAACASSTEAPTASPDKPAETAQAASLGEGEGEGSHTEGEGSHAEGDHGEGEGAHAEGEGEGEGATGHAAMKALPIEKRVAFMSGHVEAGLALYRAGAPDQAAKHLLHPVSETHADERAGIDALGFQAEVFEAVSTALSDGKPAADIEPQLAAAEANMALMQEKAGGAPADLIEYLMGTVAEEYAVGVTDGTITDPGEFQDAYGFAVVARKIAAGLEGDAAAEVAKELDTLVGLWPAGGPVADSTPAPTAAVTAQASKVLLALTALR